LRRVTTRQRADIGRSFLVALFRNRTSLPKLQAFWEGAHVNSTLKIRTPQATTLIEKIKAEIKKRAESKAKRKLLKVPKRLANR